MKYILFSMFKIKLYHIQILIFDAWLGLANQQNYRYMINQRKYWYNIE